LAGKATLNEIELLGLKVFEDEKKGNCAACHPSQPSNGVPPLFTDFTYDNLGVPRNENNPFLHLPEHFNKNGRNHKDLGLGGATHVNNSAEYGKFKVPTLRNIALTAPYMHNGVFKTLREVVEFYNTRDIDLKWGIPEVADNVNREELGNLKLTDEEMNALVIFMTTLTDGYN
jgi:cytochrome c peroxidase